jgi:hypothetical protein
MKYIIYMRNISLFTVFFSNLCFAHGAHEHGTAKLDIAFDSKKVEVNFEAPSISIYGFEHIAKSSKQKSAVAAGIKKLKENITSMLIFSPDLKCKIEKNKIDPFVKEEEDDDDVHHDEPQNTKVKAEHGNLKALFTFNCDKPLTGSLIKFSFSRFFPAIHKLNVQVLGDKVQKGTTIEGEKGELKL